MTATHSAVATRLVGCSLLLCQFSFMLERLTGVKVAYPIGLLLLMVVAAVYGRLSRRFYLALTLALGLLSLVLVQQQVGTRFANGWLPAMATYTVFPVLVLAIDTRRLDVRWIWWLLALSALPSFAGLLLQIAGVQSEMFVEEFTISNGEAIVRYNSIYGGALLFGVAAFAQLTCICLLLADQTRRATRLFLLVLATLALTCLVFSYSRRAYLSASVALVLTLALGHKTSPPSGRSRRRALLAAAMVALTVAVLLSSESVRSRLVSSADFAEDESNAIRWLRWLRALEFIQSNPLLGGGPGVMSALGKPTEDIGAAVVDADVAEMLYLNILCDFGVIGGGFLIVILLHFSADRLRQSRYQRLITVPLVIEGLAGTALQNPFILLFFLLAVSTDLDYAVEPFGVHARDIHGSPKQVLPPIVV